MLARIVRIDRPLLAGLVLISVLVAWRSIPDTPPAPASFDARCDAMDREAVRALAERIAERNEIVERSLGDALFRLQRARRNCRFGWVELARLDYIALLDGRHGRR